ncbi:DUF4870 domain-containing protein [Bacillus toyonensis]|uniref:DUF4870 domain-containing protein n=1 Tax=Bacillus toyonensis TaxID=155322 RepID=UPI000BFD3F01|nr:DUF4870 domain-containing protein [Bacillus toyonensis]PHG68931.1 hypothetical protein COI59_05025 [Bacillus toyonensis]
MALAPFPTSPPNLKTTKQKRNTIIMLLLSATTEIFSLLLMYITLARKNEVYKYHCRKAFNFHLLIFLLFNISSRISDVLFWIVFAFEVVQVIIVVWKVIRDEPYRYFIRIPLFKEDKYGLRGSLSGVRVDGYSKCGI